MKKLILLSFSLSLLVALSSYAEEKKPQESRVTVNYSSPEKFTDFTDSGFGGTSEKDLKYLTDLFTDHIQQLARQYLAADEKLEITFTDIDLAGRYEPERGPRFQDVRILRDITVPRMALTFRLFGPDGQIRAEGERKLTDLSYNMRILPPSGDTAFRHDKVLLSDWMSKEFKKRKN